MRRTKFFAAILLGLPPAAGCSQQSQPESPTAARATAEPVEPDVMAPLPGTRTTSAVIVGEEAGRLRIAFDGGFPGSGVPTVAEFDLADVTVRHEGRPASHRALLPGQRVGVVVTGRQVLVVTPDPVSAAAGEAHGEIFGPGSRSIWPDGRY